MFSIPVEELNQMTSFQLKRMLVLLMGDILTKASQA